MKKKLDRKKKTCNNFEAVVLVGLLKATLTPNFSWEHIQLNSPL